MGLVLKDCVHEIPIGSHISELPDGRTRVYSLDGTVTIIPKCNTKNGTLPMLKLRVNYTSPLPADYDGWLQYTALNTSRLGLSGGFDAFTSYMSVPDTPQEPADVLYFFPGLQNIDWIPKVDPEPNFFDIIQPVLQYPGDFDLSWSVKSWYVTLNAGALYSSAISVQPGDSIFCNMTRTGATSWLIESTLVSDPTQSTYLSADNSRLAVQPWAYAAVAECYGCSGCATYPTQPIRFTQNKLYQGGRLLSVPGPLWGVNLKPAVKEMCHEATVVDDNGDTTISFH